MENKIPTAEELIIKQYGEIYDRRGEIQKSKISRERYIELFGLGKIDNVEPGTKELMIEFAKLHAEAALKEASEKAHTDHTYKGQGGEFEDIPIYNYFVDKDSILNAYPLNNII